MLNVAEAARAVPEPFAAVFHPAKSWPARVIDPAAATVTVASYDFVEEAGADVPPFALYVRVYWLTVHWAYRVTFAFSVNVEPAALEVPEPFAAVFHPAKVCPVRVIDPAAATVTDVPAFAVCDDGGLEPLFAS
jgi:hypothetical protein